MQNLGDPVALIDSRIKVPPFECKFAYTYVFFFFLEGGGGGGGGGGGLVCSGTLDLYWRII